MKIIAWCLVARQIVVPMYEWLTKKKAIVLRACCDQNQRHIHFFPRQVVFRYIEFSPKISSSNARSKCTPQLENPKIVTIKVIFMLDVTWITNLLDPRSYCRVLLITSDSFISFDSVCPRLVLVDRVIRVLSYVNQLTQLRVIWLILTSGPSWVKRWEWMSAFERIWLRTLTKALQWGSETYCVVGGCCGRLLVMRVSGS